MDSAFMTHPTTAQQARDFTTPSSLSYSAGHLTPPASEKDAQGQLVNAKNGTVNGGNAVQATSNGVVPTTPAATPGAGGSHVSGIVPTYVPRKIGSSRVT